MPFGNGAQDKGSLGAFRGAFCTPFGIKAHQCLSLGALSKGGFCRECFLCGFWNKMSEVPLNVCFRGAFLAGVPFVRFLIKSLSLPSQTRPNFADFFIDCSIAIAAALFLRAYFALLFCRIVILHGAHMTIGFFCSRLLSRRGLNMWAVAAMPIFFAGRFTFVVYLCARKKKAPRDRGARNLILQKTIFF